MTAPPRPTGARRALVVACQTRGLAGCHNDAALVEALLRRRGFDVKRLEGQHADRAGILGAYEDLIAATGPQDTVVFYYTGHGSREVTKAGELRFILPTDIDAAGPDDFRGILADELSVLQWRLTLRTPNVTTILDCCFSSRMSRRPSDPRARGCEDEWPAAAVARRRAEAGEHFRRLRAAHPDAIWDDANPRAVRLVACGSHEVAYEGYSIEHGKVHGYLTAALHSVLSDDPDASWRAVADRVRDRVLAVMPQQRPEGEGPTDRVQFGLTVRSTASGLQVRHEIATGTAWIDGARLHGITTGDEFRLAPAGSSPRPSAPVVRVTSVAAGAALLEDVTGEPIPHGMFAHAWRSAADDLGVRVVTDSGAPDAVAAGGRPPETVAAPHVVVGSGAPGAAMAAHVVAGSGAPGAVVAAHVVAGSAAPGAVVAALAQLPGIRVRTEPGPAADDGAARPSADIATVTVTARGFMLSDPSGHPLYEVEQPVDRRALVDLRQHLQDMAVVLRLRGMDSLGADGGALATPVSLTVSAARSVVGARSAAPVCDDDVLHAGDQLWIAVTNTGTTPATVYANVLDLGVAGRISVLNESEPAGITLDAGERRGIAEEPGGNDPGLTLQWPRGVPTSAERHETVLAVFADIPQDLRGLSREGVHTRSGPLVATLLARLMRAGTRDLGRPRGVARYAIHRVTFVLCPGGSACIHRPAGATP